MRSKRRGFILVFFIFLFLSIILLSIFGKRTGEVPFGVIEIMSAPIQGIFVGISSVFGGVSESSEISQLKKENQILRSKVVNTQKIEREIAALRDQYESTSISSQKLLPGQIIGRRGFVPGVSIPDSLIINKGKDEGVKKDQVVLYNDVVIGKIAKVSTHLSEVMLLWNPSSSVTVQTSETKANGILKGKGKGAMLLENVVLSEKISVNDSVVTKGDVSQSGVGFPPDLLIGKIRSVDKKQSALFQSAEVESPISLQNISSVFIIVTSF